MSDLRNIRYRKAKKGEIPCAWCNNSIEPGWTYMNLLCHLSDSGQFAVAKLNTCDNASLVTDECKIKRRKEYLRENCGLVEAYKLEKMLCLLFKYRNKMLAGSSKKIKQGRS